MFPSRGDTGSSTAAALLAFGMMASDALGADSHVPPNVYAAWRAMRQLDCARCHGGDYTGSVGPSLLESARTRTRDEFVRLLLEGDAARGMPPYRGSPLAVETADGMYAYFRGRADGSIPAGALTGK